MFSKTILEMNDALWSSRVIFTFGHSTDEWTLAILRTTMCPKSLWICKLWIQIWPDNYFSPIMRTIGHHHHHVPSKVSGSQICRGLMTNWTTFLGCPVALPYGEVRLKMNSVPRFLKFSYFNNWAHLTKKKYIEHSKQFSLIKKWAEAKLDDIFGVSCSLTLRRGQVKNEKHLKV